ncbi:MAG: 5-methyltetrahydropteroyltriglutamate--homocysteine S-methyltransferase [Rhizobiales bacterium]|nr:5-methyltetrahydropteroyltriglutamate--homocysteine S-methyltransferase [Hyphomicrobiales bacterium]
MRRRQRRRRRLKGRTIVVSSGNQRPFRAEHVGSFPRPQTLIQARNDYAAGKIALADLRRAEDTAIAEVVAMQERVGVGAVTDGEFRRTSWRDAPFEHFHGFSIERYEADFTFRLFDGTTRKAGPVPSVIGKVNRREPMTADHFEMLKGMTKGVPKANLPTPSVTHFFRGKTAIDPKVYPDLDRFFDDVARAYREEIADLAARGCKYLQMDEVPLTVICDPNNKEIVRSRGEDPDKVIDAYIDVINAAICDRPADMTVCLHMCRGNQGHGMADGGYDAIAERLFNRLEIDGYFLEYDTPRAGDFDALRFLPKGKRAAIGIISTKHPEAESADSLKRRIDEASRSIELDQLCLCPQCGFSSNVGTGKFALDTVERKLARMVEVADQVWGR